MRRLQLPFKSNLHPMIHTFKNSSGRITKQYLCYSPKGKLVVGKADHKYDPVNCGWQGTMVFIYSGPLFACRRCHRHIWSKESHSRCPQCGGKLNAENVLHTPVFDAAGGVPAGGVPNQSQFGY